MTRLIRLSPIDHLFTGRGAYPINFVFFFDGRLDGTRLRQSLDEACSSFTPCSSRLETLDGDANSLVFAMDEGSDTYLWGEKEFDQAIPKEDLGALQGFCVSAASVPGRPLMAVTLTHTPEGSCLGVSISHCVVDGYSYFMFLTAWAQLLQGQPAIVPQLDRALLLPERGDGLPVAGDLEPLVFERSGFSLVKDRRPGDEAEVRWQINDFSKTELDQLYSQASSHVPQRLSVNDVLSAELWKRFSRELQQAGDELIFSCAYDYRRIYRRIGPTYFGNAIRVASFKCSFTEVQEMPLGRLAALISAIIKSIDARAVESSLHCLENLRREHGLEMMERFHVAHPQRGFLVTNLSRLPLLQLDFGAGPPKDFRILTPAKRTSVVLPLNQGLRVQTAI